MYQGESWRILPPNARKRSTGAIPRARNAGKRSTGCRFNAHFGENPGKTPNFPASLIKTGDGADRAGVIGLIRQGFVRVGLGADQPDRDRVSSDQGSLEKLSHETSGCPAARSSLRRDWGNSTNIDVMVARTMRQKQNRQSKQANCAACLDLTKIG